jgi:hypothetical protein
MIEREIDAKSTLRQQNQDCTGKFKDEHDTFHRYHSSASTFREWPEEIGVSNRVLERP